MKIIVIGNGKIGKTLINKLNKEGHEIIVIDKKIERIEDINNALDVLCINGDGLDLSVLNEAGVSSADLVVAVTGSDELNIVISMLSKSKGAKNVIARIRSKEYVNQNKFIKRDLDIDYAINPELRTAREIANQFKLIGDFKIESIAKGKVELISFKLEKDNKLIGLNLSQINKKHSLKMLICAVERNGEIVIPKGDFNLELSDIIYFIVSNKDLSNVINIINQPQRKNNHVFIVGAGKLSYYLCKELSKMDLNIKIIDNDISVCEKMAEEFPKITVIHGNASNQHLLEEEGLFNSDAFISLTSNDELNIILSLYAKKKKINKVITKVNQSSYLNLIKEFGLTNIFTPRDVIVDKILAYVRSIENTSGKSAIAIHRLVEEEVEALEFYVDKEFSYIDIPLKDLKIQEGVLIAGVVRKGEFIIADGNLSILEKDIVILMALKKKISNLNDII